jgi:hypothetical protein
MRPAFIFLPICEMTKVQVEHKKIERPDHCALH